MLSTTKMLLNDKRVARAKINCLIHNISSATKCLLLLVIICQMFHDIRMKLDEIEYQKYIVKMGNNHKLKEINIKNRTCYYFNDLMKSKLVYSILYKTMTGVKLSRFNKVSAFIKVFDGTKY